MSILLEEELREALKSDQIVPYFQPLVNLRSGQLVGFEVLARWLHPQRGLIAPGTFIPTAEKSGQIDQLMEQVLARACATGAGWPDHLRMSINVSPRQLQRNRLAAKIVTIADEAGFPPNRLVVEITETALIGNCEIARTTLASLKAAGVGLALDDFGMGYSNLRHLQMFPFDRLKIDASFTQGMDTTRESRKIVAAIVGLGHSLGLATIAEGIETKVQADMLVAMSCDIGQGWLFGRPVPAAEVPTVIAVHDQHCLRHADPVITTAIAHNLEALPAQRLAQLQAIYHGAPVGLCFLDRNLRYVSLNQRWADVNGRAVGAHIGRTVAEMVPEIYQRVEPYLHRALAGQVIEDLEVRRRAPTDPGREIVTVVTLQPAFDEVHEVVGISLAMVDITERKHMEEALRESEAHYRSMVELNPQTPWTAEPDGRTATASGRWTMLTGYTEAETLGMGWRKALHPDDLPAVETAWARSLETGEPFDVRYRLRLANGSYRWMRARAAPRRDPQGHIIRWYGTLEDVHEHKVLEEAFCRLADFGPAEPRTESVMENARDR